MSISDISHDHVSLDAEVTVGDIAVGDVSIADGDLATLGAKADAKSTATDTTAISAMSVLKQISASVQSPATHPCTVVDGGSVTLGAKADAKSTATDTTAITVMSVLKQISASVQAPPSQAVTNAGTFAVQATLTDISSGEYETVAASQTAQSLGATGGTGDYLAGLLIVPGTTSPGSVLLKDGSGSNITIFTGGATSVSNLVPFFVPLGIKSTSGAWKVTTGADVTAIGVGNFT